MSKEANQEKNGHLKLNEKFRRKISEPMSLGTKDLIQRILKKEPDSMQKSNQGNFMSF